METFAKLLERFPVFVYHCFDRVVIQGYLPLLTRPEHIVHFFRNAHVHVSSSPPARLKLPTKRPIKPFSMCSICFAAA
jgi:hypothetical protein